MTKAELIEINKRLVEALEEIANADFNNPDLNCSTLAKEVLALVKEQSHDQ